MKRLPSILLLVVILHAAEVDAWKDMDGNSVPPHPVWSSMPVHWSMHSAGSADLGPATSETVLLDSFATWSEPGCTSWATAYDGTTSEFPGSGSRNVQGWVESGWPYGSGAIGVCSVAFASSTQIVSADIAYNGVNYTWVTSGGGGSSVDTQSIATHEQGHFLGLGDLYGGECWDDQTMCGVYSGGTGARTLSGDDIDGLCTLYPSGAGDCVTDDDCDPGYHCEGGYCVPDPTGGEPCDPCTTHEECGGTTDLCLSGFPDGGSYCGAACTTPADCPTGYECIEVGGSPADQCVPPGYDCDFTPPECVTNDDCPDGEICVDGTCVPEPDCTTNDDCPPGEICVDGDCVPDPSPHLPMCAECTSHSDCGYEDDLCLGGFVDGVQHCGVSCDSVGGNCGEGNICYHFDDLPDQCVPADMDCSPDCATDEDCPPGSRCVDGFCSNLCDPASPMSCPTGFYCHFTGCGTGVCEPAPPEPGTRQVGDRCSTDHDCVSLRCQTTTTGSFCSASCDYLLGGGSCPAPAGCQPLERGLCGYCSCSAGMLGDACSSDSQCQNGMCRPVEGVNLCVAEFTGSGTECPVGFVCSGAVCVPELGAMGESCESDSECAGGICLVSGTSQICTRACRDSGCTCPLGYSCGETPEGAAACVPSNLVMTSGCGCTLVGSRSDAGRGIALALTVLGGIILLLGRRKIRS